MKQQPLIHDYMPTVLIETVRGDVGQIDVWDNDDEYAEQVLCDHGHVCCDECAAEALEMWK